MPLSIADKVLRLSLTTFSFLDASQFFPALSTYKVDRTFELAEFEEAMKHFFRGNPLFSKCRLVELTFDSPEDFPLSSFQELLAERYESYYDSFLLASVTYRSDPHRQGIFTCVPFPLQDGYKTFRFHQALMRTLKTREDGFQITQGLAELGIRADELADFLPSPEAVPSGANKELPVTFTESIDPPTRIGPFLDRMRRDFLARDSGNMFVLKNSLYSPKLPLGNSLQFLTVPRSVIEQGSGMQIRDYYRAEEQRQMDLLSRVELRDDFIEAGRARIGGMVATPDVFAVNNYGNVSAHDGSDIEADRGTLVRYEWHMPIIVLGLTVGMRSGLSWTITIRDKAFNFATVRTPSRDEAVEAAVGNNPAASVA
ncbi:hypothetical protein [Streptomyces sp. NPDC048111]|uniref:hypothetical protein n=1 Tax=Streptomyces sp. NPDC048111 TaxID=3365500 RepID=UPI0037158DF7